MVSGPHFSREKYFSGCPMHGNGGCFATAELACFPVHPNPGFAAPLEPTTAGRAREAILVAYVIPHAGAGHGVGVGLALSCD